MRREILALAALAAMATAAMAAGAEGKDCVQHRDGSSNCDDCLLKDNRPNLTEYCIKDGSGMSKKEIDAWYLDYGRREVEELTAKQRAREEPSLGRCVEQLHNAQRMGTWGGRPSQSECVDFANRLQEKAFIEFDKALKEDGFE